MIPRTISHKVALDNLGTEHDPDVMLATWRDAKNEITWLVENDFPDEAEILLASFGRSFSSVKIAHVSVLREVISAFPVNQRCTLKYLGVNDDVDDYIVKHKLLVEHFATRESDGFREVLLWASKKQDLALIERVVKHISYYLNDYRPGSQSAWSEAAHSIIRQLITNSPVQNDLSGEIDKTIAEMMVIDPQYRRDGAEMIQFARLGLRETFFKMLSLGLFRKFSPTEFMPDEVSMVLEMLPLEPNPREMHWIHMGIDLPGYAEKILFDPLVDMEQYIEALRTTDFKLQNNGHHLTYTTLSTFGHLLKPEHLTTPDRRRRARMLVNAICKEENAKTGATAEKVRDALMRLKFDPIILKMCDLTKGLVLEEDLGL